jgi:bifunctional non-homologous end joining protein LigD
MCSVSLREYREKRDFHRTREPEGRGHNRSSSYGHLTYVVQKHAATRLHYDLRLELNGVLKSWAVPKGPCLDPDERRLAVHVEDHPLAYGSFEGTIPKSEYGGGTVMLWDTGFWEPIGNPEVDYIKGNLRFVLHGAKLHGGWALIRMSGEAGEKGKNWLLIKRDDDEARPSKEVDVLREKPFSIVTGRSMEEIAAGGPSVVRRLAQAVSSDSGVSRGIGKDSGLKSLGKTAARKRDSRTRPSGVEINSILITHPERVLFPAREITKLDLASYYKSVASWILPHVAGRPLTLVRCPNGRNKECFFQKHFTDNLPREIYSILIQEKENGERPYLVIESIEGLMALVQLGTLELHPWLGRKDNPEKPDRLIFDLDPGPSIPWAQVVEAALLLRDCLQALGLKSFVKTTGGKGLHVVVPVMRRNDWNSHKEFARAVAGNLVESSPDRFTISSVKESREGKIFIDYMRNARGATCVSPYSTRARSDALVSAPLLWEELTADLTPEAFSLETLPERLHRLLVDPWEGFFKLRQSITNSMKRKAGISHLA